MSETAVWQSNVFTVYQKVAQWKDVGGVYIFAGVTVQQQWAPLYVGQAASFSDRLPSHERWAEAVQLGATRVHARVTASGVQRDLLEQSLIRAFKPPLNTQHRPTAHMRY